jgi:hypothetical protein
MVRIATPKPPRRLFRSRGATKAEMDAAIGPIPPGVEQLRHAIETIDPSATYSVKTPEGQVVTSTGAELLATARACVAIADAHEAGDKAALRRAALAFLGSL